MSGTASPATVESVLVCVLLAAGAAAAAVAGTVGEGPCWRTRAKRAGTRIWIFIDAEPSWDLGSRQAALPTQAALPEAQFSGPVRPGGRVLRGSEANQGTPHASHRIGRGEDDEASGRGRRSFSRARHVHARALEDLRPTALHARGGARRLVARRGVPARLRRPARARRAPAAPPPGRAARAHLARARDLAAPGAPLREPRARRRAHARGRRERDAQRARRPRSTARRAQA